MKNRQSPFWLLTITVFTVLVIPVLLQDGMFLDGLVNSSTARNLANGEGSFWALQYSKTFSNPFYEQLPLAIGIQAVFFKIFGDHLFVERLYSFFTALVTAFIIIRLWKQIFKANAELASMAWLPVLFWIITPVVFWSYSNNMLENTMTIFDITAVYLIVKAIDTKIKIYPRLIIAGVFVLAAFLSKGPVGLYPLATIVIYWFCFRNISVSKTFIYLLLVLLTSILLISILFITEQNAFHSISQWLSQQVINSIEGKRELAPSRFYIIGRLLSELIPIIVLSAIVFIVNRSQRVNNISNTDHRKYFLFFLVLALAASLPVCISLKQAGYYLVPSFPLYAIAAGIFAAPQIKLLLDKIKLSTTKFKIFNKITWILLIGILIFSFMQFGKSGRDKEKLKDIYAIGKVIPENSIITICPDMFYDWGLHAYLMRYFSISMDEKTQHEFYITDHNCKSELNKEYVKLEINTSIYEIYKRR